MDQIALSQQSHITIAHPNQVKHTDRAASSQIKGVEDKSGKEDKVTLSEAGKKLSEKNQQGGIRELTEIELKELEKLKARDREVRAHEQAHLTAAGPHALGGAQFKTTKGPDGNSYATSGHVSVDISKEQNPEATLSKMRIIRKAALAPGNPSSADRQIAAQAAMIEQQALKELNQATLAESEENPLKISPDTTSSKTQNDNNSVNSTNNNSGGYTAQFKQNVPNTGINNSISVFA